MIGIKQMLLIVCNIIISRESCVKDNNNLRVNNNFITFKHKIALAISLDATAFISAG